MNINLYTTTSDNNVVDKALSLVSTVTGEVKAPCTIENPNFLLSYSSGIAQCNYLYSEDFGRYYFIKERELLTGGRILLKCEVDILSTFKNSIRQINAIIKRQEHSFNAYMVDNEYICDNKSVIETKKFSGSFDTNLNLYLTIRGN